MVCRRLQWYLHNNCQGNQDYSCFHTVFKETIIHAHCGIISPDYDAGIWIVKAHYKKETIIIETVNLSQQWAQKSIHNLLWVKQHNTLVKRYHTKQTE